MSPAPETPPDPAARGGVRLFDRVLACVFVLALFIPLAGTVFHWDIVPVNTERRVPAAFPRWPHTIKESRTYADKFLAAYADNFGFRKALIHGLQDVRFRTGMLTPTEEVIPGSDGWLYVREGARNSNFSIERGFDPFTEEELAAWQRLFETRTAYLKNRGIQYVVTVCPDKQYLYPEHMPEELAPHGASRLDQLTAYLARNHAQVNYVDMQPALRAAAPTELLFRKTDSHWNFSGAWIGYREIMGGVARALPQYKMAARPRSDFNVVPQPEQPGDLVGMLGLDRQYQEPWPIWEPRQPVNLANISYREYDLHDPALPRMVMFHDSFTYLMIPMLGPHFSHGIFVASYDFDAALIDVQKPDIVISEMVERKLHLPTPIDPPQVSGTTLPARP